MAALGDEAVGSELADSFQGRIIPLLVTSRICVLHLFLEISNRILDTIGTDVMMKGS